MNRFPGKSLAIERAGREVFDEHVAATNQLAKNLLAFFALGIECNAPLVAVEHGEIKAVDVGLVAQLAAGDIAASRQFDFNHVGAEPREYLRASRPRLHMGHV